KNLELSFANLKTLNRCPRCFFLKEARKNLCSFCSDPKRDKNIIAVVEKETDLLSIEKTGNFQGHYLVLGELPERGILESAQKLRLQTLKERIKKELNGKAKEIIAAVNLTTFGDFTTHIIGQEFKELAEKITRLGRGIPTGGEIEFADEETLAQALERRN
ncbi:MAG: toprim domain-containing protein, partial [Patescibacteria group bacterium]